MKIGILKETFPGEKRVALVPEIIGSLVKKGHQFFVEEQAGFAAGIIDATYLEKGANIVKRENVFDSAEIIIQVRSLGASKEQANKERSLYRPGQIVIGSADPLNEAQIIKDFASTGVTAFGLELVPRITRAQSMDILSSMATVAGYKAVIWAAERLPKFFPMFMTAAGTIRPAKVFVIGAGVAGLQAIATAKRLGAVVNAYDVRPAVKEQVESLGGKFVEMELDTAESQDEGGYAKALGEDFYRRQRELMARVVAENDVVITTAAVPGGRAPILVTAEMVKSMRPGSVIIDLAAERGGNCELTKAGEDVVEHDVSIFAPLNVASTVPYHASQMFAKNAATFLENMIDKEGNFSIDMNDEIISASLLIRDGKLVNNRLLEMLKETNVNDSDDSIVDSANKTAEE